MDYGETSDVQEVHAAIQREKREPRVGLEPLSIWLIAVYGLAIFSGGAYLGRYSGNFSGDGLDPMMRPAPVEENGRSGPEGGPKRRTFSARSRQERFSPRIARPAIKRMVTVFPANIRLSLVRNSPMVVRVAWR